MSLDWKTKYQLSPCREDGFQQAVMPLSFEMWDKKVISGLEFIFATFKE